MDINLIGRTLRGRYHVIRQLGRGGIGITFLAEDLQCFNSLCVVKQLKPQSCDRDTLTIARRLFAEEANTLVELGNHDQIPRLLAYFEENEEFFLVQEFIDGYDLSTEIIPSQPWNEEQVIAFLTDLCNTLALIEKHGVIHRDLKPSNLMRRKSDGKIIIIDFGAVKRISTHVANEDGKFAPTVVIHTQGYTAPEQMNGFPKLSSDIYSLGIIVIQAITGVIPKQLALDEKGEIRWRDRLNQELNYHPKLLAIVDKMVRYAPQERYQSAQEILNDLAKLQAIKSNRLITKITSKTRIDYQQNNKKLLVGSSIAIAAIMIIMSIGLWKFFTKKPIPLTSYSNDEYGIKISYPQNWSTENRDDFFTTGVIFIAPAENSQDNFHETISVFIEDFSSALSLQQYTEESILEIKRLSDPNLKFATPSTLAHQEARKVIYYSQEEGNPVQRMQIWTIKNNRVYIITYTAEPEKYQRFLPLAENMINSLEITQ